ncbi:hypothetical protein D3C80_1255120 [compost metagenome]
MITGKVTSVAGACAMPSMRMTMASIPAPGTPLTTKPTPISNIWMKAMPITPCATARMVAVHSVAKGLPRSAPETRMAMRWVAISPRSPKAMMTPEMMIAPMNRRKAPPALAAAPSTVSPAPLIWGIH